MSIVAIPSRQATGRSVLVEELAEVMLRQESLCKRLLELSAQERLAVLSGHVDDLEYSVREKRRLLQELEWQETARKGAAERLAHEVGLGSEASLAELAQRLGVDSAQGLLEIRTRLLVLTGKLKETNEDSLFLLRRSLSSLRDSLRRLRQSIEPAEVYGSSGQPVLATVGRRRAALDIHA